MTRGIERTFPRPFSETFRISKNEDFNGPYLENENEFLKNSFETVFRASESCDRGQLVSAFQLTFNGRKTVKIKTRSRDAAEIKPSGKDIGKLLGLLPVNSSSHCSGSSPFQKVTVRYDKGLRRLKGETRLPECSLSLSRGQKRTGMVKGLLKNEQWQKHFAPGRTIHNILRHFQARMGGHI